MDSSDEIVFSISQSQSNQSFLYKTFDITNTVYVNNTLDICFSKDQEIPEFDNRFFTEMKNRIISQGGQANYNKEETIILIKAIQFTLKYLDLNPSEKLFKILKSKTYPNANLFKHIPKYGSKFNYEQYRQKYEEKAHEILKKIKKLNKHYLTKHIADV